MSRSDAGRPPYVVPSYRSPPDTSWYHALHGNVPGHQIDYIYRPELPQGPLTQQHFSHLDRLVQCIEPRAGSLCAFAIGNLSRDDTQHEPGHGAISLIVGLRVRGATDHAGRRDPPFAHAVMAIDRHLDRAALLRSALLFHDHIIDEVGLGPKAELSHMYSKFAAEDTSEGAAALRAYVASFDGLPALPPSALRARWSRIGPEPPQRVFITHADDAPFEAIARCAARLAAVLYESDIRWTSITTGSEADAPNGVSIRFIPRRDVAGNAADGLVLPMDRVPKESADIASQLFGLSPKGESGRFPARAARGPYERAVASDTMTTGGGQRGAARRDPELRSRGVEPERIKDDGDAMALEVARLLNVALHSPSAAQSDRLPHGDADDASLLPQTAAVALTPEAAQPKVQASEPPVDRPDRPQKRRPPRFRWWVGACTICSLGAPPALFLVLQAQLDNGDRQRTEDATSVSPPPAPLAVHEREPEPDVPAGKSPMPAPLPQPGSVAPRPAALGASRRRTPFMEERRTRVDNAPIGGRTLQPLRPKNH